MLDRILICVLILISESSVDEVNACSTWVKQPVPSKAVDEVFLKAVADYNKAEIIKLIDKVPKRINDRIDKDDKTILMVAVLNDDDQFVKDLLDRNPNKQLRDKSGETATAKSVLHSNNDMVLRRFVDDGSDVNERINGPVYSNITLVMAAIIKNRFSLAEILINAGCDINSKDVHGRCVLGLAVASNNESLVATLLNRRADPNLLCQENKSTMELLCTTMTSSMARILIGKGAQCTNNIANCEHCNPSTATSTLPSDSTTVPETTISPIDISNVDARVLIFTATADNNASLVLSILNLYPSLINESNSERQTIVMIATLGNHTNLAISLLSRQPNLELEDPKGYTAIVHAALMVGSDSLTRQMALSGAKVDVKLNQPEYSNMTLMMAAIVHERNSIVEVLLDTGADSNAEDDIGRTALYLAVNSSNIAMIGKLLDKGAEINRRNADGRTVLELLCAKSPDNIVDYILQRGAQCPTTADCVKCQDLYFLPFLAAVSSSNLTGAVWYLDRHPAFNNAKTPSGATALMVSCENTHNIEIVSMLLSRGADVNLAEKANRTAVDYVYWGEEFMELFWKNGLSSNVNIYGENMLFFYARTHYSSLLNMSLTYGEFDLNVINEWGETPLFRAALNRGVDVVRILIEFGVDVNYVLPINNGDGHTVLNFFCESLPPNIANPLISAGAVCSDFCSYCTFKDNLEFLAEVSNGNEAKVRQLLDANPSLINATTPRQKRAVTLATEFGHYDMVVLLLARGADVNSADVYGDTALNHVWQVKYLNLFLQNGLRHDIKVRGKNLLIFFVFNEEMTSLIITNTQIDINGKDDDGYTALYYAVASGYTATVQILMQHGVDLNFRMNGQTVMEMFCRNGSSEIILLLSSAGANCPIDCSFCSDQVTNNDLNAVSRLLEANPYLNFVTSPAKETALILAAKKYNYDMTGLLLSKGADANAMDDKNRTALSYVYFWAEYLEIYLNHGLSHETKLFGDNLLIFYAGYLYPSAARTVLSSTNIDKNEVDSNGYTALYYAVRNNDKLTITTLIDFDVDLNFRLEQHSNKTALQILCPSTSPDIVLWMHESGAHCDCYSYCVQ